MAWICDKCGAKNEEKNERCLVCNEPRNQSVELEQEEKVQKEKEEKELEILAVTIKRPENKRKIIETVETQQDSSKQEEISKKHVEQSKENQKKNLQILKNLLKRETQENNINDLIKQDVAKEVSSERNIDKKTEAKKATKKQNLSKKTEAKKTTEKENLSKKIEAKKTTEKENLSKKTEAKKATEKDISKKDNAGKIIEKENTSEKFNTKRVIKKENTSEKFNTKRVTEKENTSKKFNVKRDTEKENTSKKFNAKKAIEKENVGEKIEANKNIDKRKLRKIIIIAISIILLTFITIFVVMQLVNSISNMIVTDFSVEKDNDLLFASNENTVDNESLPNTDRTTTAEKVEPGSLEEVSEESSEEESTVAELQEVGINRYIIYKENVTWEQAYQSCKDKGGYLLHINSDEEYEYIKKDIIGETYKSLRFFLGATREPDSKVYQWVDNNRNLYGGDLTVGLYKSYWMANEPSFSDSNTKEEEYYVDFFYSKESNEWFWNDISNDIGKYYSGNIAYICEYED